MTVLIGILCSDGVVIASDSAATFGTGMASTIGQQTVRKVYKLGDSMIFASTGAVGIGQVIGDSLKDAWDKKAFSSGAAGASTAEQLMHRMGQHIGQTVLPYLQTAHLARQLGAGDGSASLCKSVLAVEWKNTPCLFTFDFNGAPERASESLPFVALGSGQSIADPFLAFLKRVVWADSQPTLAEGKLAATWTIDHVCKTNPGGVGGAVQLMVLPKGKKILEVDDTEVGEHAQQATVAEQALLKSLKPAEVANAGMTPMPQPPPTS